MEGSDFDSLKQEGDNAFKNKNYQEAIEKYNEILLTTTTSAIVYQNIALCYK